MIKGVLCRFENCLFNDHFECKYHGIVIDTRGICQFRMPMSPRDIEEKRKREQAHECNDKMRG
mgnify:CR=1 FL=1